MELEKPKKKLFQRLFHRVNRARNNDGDDGLGKSSEQIKKQLEIYAATQRQKPVEERYVEVVGEAVAVSEPEHPTEEESIPAESPDSPETV